MIRTKKLEEFWERDESLTILLGAVGLLVFFVYPLADLGWLAKSFLAVAGTLVLASGLLVVSRTRTHTVLAAILAALAFISDATGQFIRHPAIPVARSLCYLGFLGLLNSVILRRVLRAGPVNRHRIQGAVLAYLILGLMWAQAYRALEILAPGSFTASAAPVDLDQQGSRLTYYSFVTLTTLGYGDITPLAPFARSLAVLEALIGQLFPAILIARLVAMELESSKPQNPAR